MKKPVIRTAVDALLAMQQGFELTCMRGKPFNMARVASRLMFLEYSSLGTKPTPETAHLLEPQDGDLVRYIDPISDAVSYAIVGQDHRGLLIETESGTHSPEGCPVILRNSKPFPKWEVEE